MVISWQNINKENCIGRKYIDKSMFKYGLHIPIEYIEGFIDNIKGKYIELGKYQHIDLIFDDYTATVELRNINSKGRSETIQIRYDGNKEFRQYLKEKFIYTYELIESEQNNIDTDEYLEFYKDEYLNKFSVKYHINKKGISMNSKNLDISAIEFIETIKKEKMSKSYKIPTLLAFYNDRNIKPIISYDEIGHALKDYYSLKMHREDIDNYENQNLEELSFYINKAKETSMKFLPKEYFIDDRVNKQYKLDDKISRYVDNKKFVQEYIEAIYFLERKYFNISEKEQFIKWMKENTKLAQSSIDKYASAVNKVAEIYRNDKEYLYNIFDNDILYIEIESIKSNKDFNEKDIKGNRMYSNGLKQFLEYRSSNYYKKDKLENEIIDMNNREILINISKYIENQGYTYTQEQLSNLFLSLKTKPFVILAGISGTGKSKIVRLFAESLGATIENKQFNMISVRPDWNDGTELMGYKNLNDDFIDGSLTKIIKEASKPENKNKPYFACLDEMNLARVEYYLSDYLSIIESRKKVGQDIITDSELQIPDNIYLIGTVNMDDTTFIFSRKVLDRANTIEFSDVNLENLFEEITEEEITPIKVDNRFLKTTYLKTMDIEEEYREYAKEINKKIIEINNILKQSQKQFAYRVRDEILFYMIENKKSELLNEDVAFDYQIMQKILPAITGSEQSIAQVLIDLFNFTCEGKVIDDIDIEEAQKHVESTKYKKSAEKIVYMLKGYQNDGYISYWY